MARVAVGTRDKVRVLCGGPFIRLALPISPLGRADDQVHGGEGARAPQERTRAPAAFETSELSYLYRKSARPTIPQLPSPGDLSTTGMTDRHPAPIRPARARGRPVGRTTLEHGAGTRHRWRTWLFRSPQPLRSMIHSLRRLLIPLLLLTAAPASAGPRLRYPEARRAAPGRPLRRRHGGGGQPRRLAAAAREGALIGRPATRGGRPNRRGRVLPRRTAGERHHHSPGW